MKWFKAISPYDPIMKPIMDELGFEGYGRFLAVLDYCQRYDLKEINEEVLANSAGTNRRGARKLLPMFRECLVKVWVMFGESFPNVYPNNGESLGKQLPNFGETLGKLDPQNPHGSTRDQEREELDKREKKTPPKKISEADIETAKFIFEKVKLVAPSTKTPNLDKWADSVRLMVQEDHHTHAEIRTMMTWANQDSFWRANILSPATLREKWPKLEARQNSPSAQSAKPTGSQIPANRILLAHERTGGSGKL